MAKIASYVLGVVMFVLGVVGFSSNPILGIFKVDVIHNLIYIVLGAVLVLTMFYNSRIAAKIVGVVLAIVAILGFISPTSSILGVAETNIASSILEAVFAVILLGAGFLSGGEVEKVKKQGAKTKQDPQQQKPQQGNQQRQQT